MSVVTNITKKKTAIIIPNAIRVITDTEKVQNRRTQGLLVIRDKEKVKAQHSLIVMMDKKVL